MDVPQLQRLCIAAFFWMYFLYFVREVLDRVVKLYPNIYPNSAFESMDDPSINKRLTKQYGLNSKYRIESTGTVHLSFVIWKIVLAILSIHMFFISEPHFLFDHLIKMDPKSVKNNEIYGQIAIAVASGYSWELFAIRYGKLEKAMIAHHMIACIMGFTTSVFEYYNPFISWFVLCATILPFPNNIVLGLRTTKFAYYYPNIIRNWLKCGFFWFIFVEVCNIGGQAFMLINGIFILEKVSIWTGLVVIVMCITLLFDDYNLLKALNNFSSLKYENLQLYGIKKRMYLEDDIQEKRAPDIKVAEKNLSVHMSVSMSHKL